MKRGKDRDHGLALINLMKCCAKRKDIRTGATLHAQLAERELINKNPYVASALISMYAKCGVLEKAKQVLEGLPVTNTVCWNALIAGYAQQGQAREATKCLERMQKNGISPDAVTFTCILKACGRAGNLEVGEQMAKEIVSRHLLEKNMALGNSLVDMYAKCGEFAKARGVLDRLLNRDVVSWNAMIAGYIQNGRSHEALKSFEQMQSEGLCPDVVSFICILKACGSTRDLDRGRQIHDEISSRGLLGKDIVLSTALVDMYAKCGALRKALRILRELPVRDVCSWSAVIAGYAHQGLVDEAFSSFREMLSEGIDPDLVTFICILKACGSTREIDAGEKFHEYLLNKGLLEKDIMLSTALVDMYAKCGALIKAKQVLQELPFRNVVSWNALIGGYAEHGQCRNALDCFGRMKNEGSSPDPVTFISVLKACSSKCALAKGKQVHDEIASRGFVEKDIVIGATLVDMYAKCGVPAKAHEVLLRIPVRNAVCWNALIAGYAAQGKFQEVLNCFRQLEDEGISPDEITFLCILSACNHSGQLDKARVHFEYMTANYGIYAKLKHHINLLVAFGCAGHFEQAMTVIKVIPHSDCAAVWRALLGACKKWGNVELGRLAFDQSVQLDNSSATVYTLMADIFAAAGRPDDAKNVITLRPKYVHPDATKQDCLNARSLLSESIGTKHLR